MPFAINGKPATYPDRYDQCSDDPATLHALLGQITITAQRHGIVPSPWEHMGRKCDALLYVITVSRGTGKPFSFNYYASHVDAQLFKAAPSKRTIKAIKEHMDSLPYDILCCIGSDYSVCDSDPEDFGMDSDSIKDMAKWNKMRDHSRKLRQALRLTDEELACLPA